MNLMDIRGNTAVLMFNTLYYSEQPIISALTEFWSEFDNQFNAFISLGGRPRYLKVVLLPKRGRISRKRVYDFCNSVLLRCMA